MQDSKNPKDRSAVEAKSDGESAKKQSLGSGHAPLGPLHSTRWDRQLDAVLGDAVRDVPVPEGLRQRLLASLATRAAGEPDERLAGILAAVDLETSPADNVPELSLSRPAEPCSVESPSGKRSNRLRWAVVITAVLAAPFAVGLGLAAFFQQGDVRQVERLARDWVEKVAHQDTWRQGVASAPKNYPVASAVLAGPRRWQTIRTRLDGKAVVYDMTAPGRRRVMLFVLRPRGKLSVLPSSPPSPPSSTTGGWSIGAWQSRGLVYVLTVEGSSRRYRRLIWAAPPLAMTPRNSSPVILTGKV